MKKKTIRRRTRQSDGREINHLGAQQTMSAGSVHSVAQVTKHILDEKPTAVPRCRYKVTTSDTLTKDT